MKKPNILRRMLCMLLTLALACGLCACSTTNEEQKEITTSQETETQTETSKPQDTTKEEEKKNMLDGKSVIFIGDSFMYYGNMVCNSDTNTINRFVDTGYFYQICKANGANVSVTNWTYGGKGIAAIYKEKIPSLKNLYYDYVILNCGRNSANTADAYYGYILDYIELFREVNPNVKFLFLVSSGCHNISVAESFPIDLLNNLNEFEETFGITIVDWGKMVADIIRGEVEVPGATQTFNKSSFVVNRTSGDGFHPNMLAGYITALMTYCTITGESAIDQPYDFYNNSTIHSYCNVNTYLSKFYPLGTTNFTKIFESPDDMKGLQTLVDQYIAAKHYKNYNFTK